MYRCRQRDSKRVSRNNGVDTQQQRQCVSGHVIRLLGRAIGIEAPVGIVLYLEQRLCERGVGLAQHDDVRSRGVSLALQCEGLQGGSDFDVAAVQDAQHCTQRDGVLSRGDDVRVRPLAPPSHRARLDGEEIRQPMLALRGRVREQRVRAVRLIGDDVANRPATAAPGVREIPRSFARVITARPGLEPVKWDLDGRG